MTANAAARTLFGMARTLVALIATTALLLVGVPAAQAGLVANAEATQPSGCTVGTLTLDYAEGIAWEVDGDPVTVRPGGLDLPYPDGFNSVVVARDASTGETVNLFDFQIAAVSESCVPADYAGWFGRLGDRVDLLMAVIAEKVDQIEALETKVTGLEGTIATQKSRIASQSKVVKLRGKKIAALRKQLRQCRLHGC